MPYEAHRLPNEPIIVVTFTDPFDFNTQLRPAFASADKLVQPNEMFYILLYDITRMSLNFSELTSAMSDHTLGLPGSLSDPRVRMLVVGAGPLVVVAREAFKLPQYGSLDMPIFDNMPAALDEARAEIKKRT